jgi:uncharacterized protein YjbI with pentapeptide repeats
VVPRGQPGTGAAGRGRGHPPALGAAAWRRAGIPHAHAGEGAPPHAQLTHAQLTHAQLTHAQLTRAGAHGHPAECGGQWWGAATDGPTSGRFCGPCARAAPAWSAAPPRSPATPMPCCSSLGPRRAQHGSAGSARMRRGEGAPPHAQLTHAQLTHAQLTHAQLTHAQLTHSVLGALPRRRHGARAASMAHLARVPGARVADD